MADQSIIYLILVFSSIVFVFYRFEADFIERNEKTIESMQTEIQNRNTILNEVINVINNLNTNKKMKPRFRRRLETQNVDCRSVIHDRKNAQNLLGPNRIRMVETKNINLTCSAIRNRILPPKPLESLKFGVAFARIVYTDYELIEDQIRASYHSQNLFCFAIDSRADEDFHGKLRALTSCFSNILVVNDEVPVDSKGHNVNLAHYNCLKVLVTRPGWGYAMLLQNHDIVTKSVYELVRIFDIFGGANDVLIAPSQNRVDKTLNWNPYDLELYPTPTNVTLTMPSSAAQASFSFAAVEWMVKKVDLTKIINQLNTTDYGVDEILWGVLQTSEILKMPGRFTSECIDQGISTPHISRYSKWKFSGEHCENFRHDICVLGVEHLAEIVHLPNIVVNKMLPSFDYAAIDCLNESIFNRTILQLHDFPLNETFYEKMVNVQYHKHCHEPDFKLQC